MAKAEFKALSNFIKASRNKPQSVIIKEFLSTIIKGSHVSESGSVHVNNPLSEKLILYNDKEFLTKQGFLPKNEPWSKEFGYYDGIAGLAYRTNDIHVINDVSKNEYFTERDGDVPIANIVCVPILVGNSSQAKPFGVASFHNSDINKTFSDDDAVLIKAYTDVLGVMLEISQHRLDWEKSRRVFIVHGHDKSARYQLESIIRSYGLEPVVMQEELRTGGELLQMLETLIKGCRGGFVIATPDDEGRIRKDPEDELKPRARQNVVFESGMLTSLFRASKNVCFLVKEPLELPSDMRGLLYESFKDDIDQRRIEKVLESWEMIHDN